MAAGLLLNPVPFASGGMSSPEILGLKPSKEGFLSSWQKTKGNEFQAGEFMVVDKRRRICKVSQETPIIKLWFLLVLAVVALVVFGKARPSLMAGTMPKEARGNLQALNTVIAPDMTTKPFPSTYLAPAQCFVWSPKGFIIKASKMLPMDKIAFLPFFSTYQLGCIYGPPFCLSIPGSIPCCLSHIG